MSRVRNAFYFFMLDYKQSEEKRGHTFPNGLRDLQNDKKCQETWNNLSPQDKTYYKNKGKNSALKRNKKTQNQDFYEEDEKNKRLQKEFLLNMKHDISSIVTEASLNNCIKQLKFYAIHVNFFYTRVVNNEAEYCPAEIAIAEFSLEKGITRTYHKIINSEIQLGYAAEASNYSKETHQIPKNPCFGEKDYSVIYNEICAFLQPGKKNEKLPPLFTWFKVVEIRYPVIYVLNKLATFNKDFKDTFTVYSFEELFANLRNINIGDDNNVLKYDDFIASLKLQNDPMIYNKDIQCEYHKMVDGGCYCSKSFVQRWIYTLYKYVCILFEISLLEGVHTPTRISGQAVIKKVGMEKNVDKPKESDSNKTISNEIKESCEIPFSEKKCLKTESLMKQLKITNHPFDKELNEGSLRVPYTKSIAYSIILEKSSDTSLDENYIAGIGRGMVIKKTAHNNRS